MPRAVLVQRVTWGLALLSLAVGLWRSLDPDALVDFTRVVGWAAAVWSGTSPWAGDTEADYPPWAVVWLVPISWLPSDMQAPVWIALNIGVAVWLACAVVNASTATPAERSALVALLLATSVFRVLGQFSLVTVALAWAGIRQASPARGGLLLGVALMKPHVAGAFVLAQVIQRDWLRVAVAVVVPVVATTAVAWWLSLSPLTVISDYRAVLEVVQGGGEVFAGHTDLEPWLAPWIPGVTSVAGSLILMGVLSLVVAAVTLGHPPTRLQAPDVRLELYALCGAAALLGTRHLSYDYLLLLPLLAAWRAWPCARPIVPPVWRLAWAVLAVWLVVQPLGWWRRVFLPMGVTGSMPWVLELDRGLTIALFGLLVWRFMRLDVTK